METIWNSSLYPNFLYAASVLDLNPAANTYLQNHFHIAGTPTSYFDDGNLVLVGGYPDTASYTTRIRSTGARATSDVYLWAKLVYVSNTQLNIEYAISSRELTNNPPEVPSQPSGPVVFRVGQSRQFVTHSADPEGDQVYYRWVYSPTDTSAWQGPFDSGSNCTIDHQWANAGTFHLTVLARDGWINSKDWSTPLNIVVYRCGDADGSGSVDISDAVYLISYIFGGGPAPNPVNSGDADGSGSVDISDAVFLISYIFGGGPAPCP